MEIPAELIINRLASSLADAEKRAAIAEAGQQVAEAQADALRSELEKVQKAQDLLREPPSPFLGAPEEPAYAVPGVTP